MSTDIEGKAEEYIDAEFFGYSLENAYREAIKDAYLAGYNQALQDNKPVKIDPEDESTWPPYDTTVLGYREVNRIWIIVNVGYDPLFFPIYSNDADGLHTPITHWVRNPKIEEESK